MIELYDNLLQIVLLLLCGCIALVRVIRSRDKVWVLLVYFYASWTMGDLYWLAHLAFFGDTPDYAYVSDVSWYASYIFLYLVMDQILPAHEVRERPLLPWLGPLFTAGMAAFYMQYGQYVSNALTAILLGLLLYHAILRLRPSFPGVTARKRLIVYASLLFCFIEYATWTISCFAGTAVFDRLYLVGELLISLYMPFLLWMVGKAAAA